MAKETRKEKIERLVKKAENLEIESDFLEGQFHDIVDEIKSLKPNKKEIEEYNLQYLFDCYNMR